MEKTMAGATRRGPGGVRMTQVMTPEFLDAVTTIFAAIVALAIAFLVMRP